MKVIASIQINKERWDFVGKLYTCEEISKYYRVPLNTVRFWIRNKKISAIKVGREYRISEDAIKEFEEKNKTTVEE